MQVSCSVVHGHNTCLTLSWHTGYVERATAIFQAQAELCGMNHSSCRPSADMLAVGLIMCHRP